MRLFYRAIILLLVLGAVSQGPLCRADAPEATPPTPPGKAPPFEKKAGPKREAADDRPPGGDGSMFYRVFVSRNDTDGDGAVEKSEFRGSGARFDQMDKDKDGKLSRAEIDELHRSRMADPLSMRQRIERGVTRRPPVGLRPERNPQTGPGGKTGNDDEPTALTPLGTRITAKQAFTRLDVDADGKVTADEFRRSPGMADLKASREAVAKIDSDRDGMLSFAEFERVFAMRHGGKPAGGKAVPPPAPAPDPAAPRPAQ